MSPSPNFAFLASHDPYWVVLGAQAERNFAEDPNTTLLKLRQLCEQMAQRAAANAGVFTGPQENQLDLLRRLEQRGVLGRPVAELFHSVRKAGNAAMHDLRGDRMEALHQLKLTRELAVWFHRSFGNAPKFNPGPFVPPADPNEANRAVQAELQRLREELDRRSLEAEQAKALAEEQERQRLSAEERAAREAEEREVWAELAADYERRFAEQLSATQAQAEAKPRAEVQEVVARAAKAAEGVQLDEAATRRLIDQQLRDAGFQADSDAMTHAAGVRPQKGKNVAIAEWPAGEGRADYVLFQGLEALAIVEAKRVAKDVPSMIEQAKRYGRSLLLDDENKVAGSPWGKQRVPFLFATNGRPYLKQLETKSGVWFLDARKSTNHPRALESWYTPEGLTGLLRQDYDAAYEALRNEPLDILGLHSFQRSAIRAVETALEGGRREVLLAMATGTGKTRTAIGLAYRLLKSKRVRRLLFLVDRTALGVQASDAFKDARIETSKTFADIYEIKELRDVRPEPDTRVHFATVQGLIQRILYPAEGEPVPPVDQYDCIVVDECHRGYALDRELSDDELQFKSQDDYVSLYRKVLEHFDAVRIGLTATPALHTAQIFGPPVFTYALRDAVVDGFLVDHEPPYTIATELGEGGIRWKAGEAVEAWDPSTGAIDKVNLPDDVEIEIEDFNRKVVTESFNREVCRALAEHVDPSLDEKTLVFCVNDAHADLVVKILKEVFTEKYGAVDDDAVMKITGASDQPLQLIRRYKNERLPNVAVTVDLLTTGVDVPKICNLVFLRRVRSRILYDQMIGRATRRCDEIGKEVFRIFDAVGSYAAMSKVSDMKPVVTNPRVTFEKLVEELLSVAESAHRKIVLDQLLAKLQRKVRRLSGEHLERFETVAGLTGPELLKRLREGSPEDAAEWFGPRKHLATVLDDASGGSGYPVLISHHGDVLREVTRGYGKGQKPEDYLHAFKDFVTRNLNEVPALIVVTQPPRDLTRQQLREIKLALDQEGFTESFLRTAWRESTNADIAASIIGFVRQAALGDPLVPYGERVDKALNRLLARRAWTEPQRKWLKRIGKQLQLETIVDRETLDQGRFRADGGVAMLDRVFQGELDAILGELREEIWKPTG